MKITLAVPRENVRLIADLLHLNGFKFTLEQSDGPTIIRVEVSAAQMANFDPRDTIVPIATA